MTPAQQAARDRAWLEVETLLDRQLSPLGRPAIAALAPKRGETIVDIGCGTGETVLQLAELVGSDGSVIGVDIAPLLLDRARERAAGLRQARFVGGDAAELPLEDGSVDAIFSRFGVMAFTDPSTAFATFHRILKPDGRLAFVCWRALAENELDILPLRAAGLEGRVDLTPFSFEDPVKIRRVLAGAGFRQIAIRPQDRAVSSGGLEEMLTVLLKVGALGRVLRENPELQADAERRLRETLAPRAGEVSLNAAVWIVTASA